MNSNIFVALGMVTAGAVLIYSAFQTPPDPRVILSNAFGAAKDSQKTGPPGRKAVNPRETARGRVGING